MGFVQREIDRLNAEIAKVSDGNRQAELYAAQQALSWALDPDGFRSPYDMLMGIPVNSEDCQAEPRPAPFLDISGHCG